MPLQCNYEIGSAAVLRGKSHPLFFSLWPKGSPSGEYIDRLTWVMRLFSHTHLCSLYIESMCVSSNIEYRQTAHDITWPHIAWVKRNPPSTQSILHMVNNRSLRFFFLHSHVTRYAKPIRFTVTTLPAAHWTISYKRDSLYPGRISNEMELCQLFHKLILIGYDGVNCILNT